MSKCCICGSNISDDTAAVLFENSGGTSYKICKECEANTKALLDTNDGIDALNYLLNNSDDYEDNNVSTNQIDDNNYNNGGVSSPDESYDLKSELKSEFSEISTSASNTSGWIVALRAIYKCVFWAIVLIGVVIGAKAGDAADSGTTTFVIIVISLIIGVCVCGKSLMDIDTAEDIRTIRRILEKNSKNKQ